MKLNELEDFPELGNTIVIDGIEYVKKREPLSDEKILAEIDNNGLFFKYRTFVMGIKFAERAHGITGVDDEH